MVRLPKFIRSLVGCSDSTMSRYSLGGVRVECAGGVANLVATDGRILVHVSYPEESGADLEATIDGKSLSKAFAAVAKAGANESVSLSSMPGADGQSRPVAFVEGRKSPVPAVAELLDGRFPRWRDVFPAIEPKFSIRLDCDLLATVCKVFSEAGCSKATFHFESAIHGVRIDGVAKTGEIVRGVVMPAEVDGKMPAPLDGAVAEAVAKAG